MSRASAMTFHLFGLLALLFLLSTPALTALPCKSIVKDLAPCLNFIKGTDQNPDVNCCSGVMDVAASIKSETDEQKACECAKSTLSGIKYDPDKVPALSEKCGASVVFPPISAKTDCTKFTAPPEINNNLQRNLKD